MYKHILALTIMTLTVMTTVGLIQISSVFASPPQGGNPHNQLSPCPNSPTSHTSSTGNPHSCIAPKGNPHICETTLGGSESTGAGAGKVVFEQC